LFTKLVHQTGQEERVHSIQPYVVHTCNIYEVCHDVARHVKNGNCSSLSLVWKSVDSITGIPYYLKSVIKHIVDDILSFSKTVHRHIEHEKSSWEFHAALWTPPARSWTPLITRLRSHTAAWVWVISQQNKSSSNWLKSSKEIFLRFHVLPGQALHR